MTGCGGRALKNVRHSCRSKCWAASFCLVRRTPSGDCVATQKQKQNKHVILLFAVTHTAVHKSLTRHVYFCSVHFLCMLCYQATHIYFCTVQFLCILSYQPHTCLLMQCSLIACVFVFRFSLRIEGKMCPRTLLNNFHSLLFSVFCCVAPFFLCKKDVSSRIQTTCSHIKYTPTLALVSFCSYFFPTHLFHLLVERPKQNFSALPFRPFNSPLEGRYIRL